MHLNQPSIINPSNIQAELSLAASATQSETTTYYKTTQIEECCPAALVTNITRVSKQDY